MDREDHDGDKPSEGDDELRCESQNYGKKECLDLGGCHWGPLELPPSQRD